MNNCSESFPLIQGRAAHVSTIRDDKLYIQGGYKATGGMLGDMWTINLDNRIHFH